MRKVILDEMTWPEVKMALSKAKLVIIPTGSVEQHGPHLPLKQDIASASYISKLAADKMYPRVIVSPSIPIGVSSLHLGFPGTLTLKPETFINIVVDICESLKHHGASKVAIVNGHGGNIPALGVAGRKIKDDLSLDVMVLSYWDVIPWERALEILDTDFFPGHSGEFETSIALVIHPELTHRKGFSKPVGKPPQNWYTKYRVTDFNEFTETGVEHRGGDSTVATKKKGDILIQLAVNNLVNLFEQFLAN